VEIRVAQIECIESKVIAGLASFLLTCAVSAGVTISPDHPELLQQAILAAYAAGQSSVVIPPGVYQIPPLGNGFHLDLENMNNFEIDARGATLVFQDQTVGGIYFYNCDSVLFHGATLYYATPPFSQGVVRAVAADGSSLDIQIEQGYPANLDDPNYFTAQIIGHLFDGRTRWWKRNSEGDIYGTATERMGPDTFRIFTGSVAGAEVGDLVGLRSGIGDHIMRVDASSRMTLTDLTVFNSPGGAVQEDIGGSLGPNHYTNITVKRGGRPAGATTDPLFTTIGGFGSSECRTGPIVENWSMESMPDDGIAIGGQDSWVMEAHGNTLIVSNTWVGSGTNFMPGDPLQLIDPHDALAGQAVVTNVVPLPSYQNSCTSQRTTVTDFTVGPYYQITLDRPVTAGCDYLAGNPNASGAGYVLRHNSIRNHRERAMILQADDGIVEDNVLDGSTLSAIYIGPESYWGSFGYSHNLVIRHNTIRDAGYWGGSTAALLIASNSQFGLTPAGDFQNIVIDGNTFENFNVTAMFLSSISQLVVRNNVFERVQQTAPFEIDNRGQDVLPGTLVFVANSDAAEFQGNTTSQLGPYNTTFVEVAPGSNVQGTPYVSVIAGSDADFSDTQGSNNWSYGYFPSGDVNSFTLLPIYNAQSAWWQHPTFGPPWTLVGANSLFQPNDSGSGALEWATRRWVSDVSGSVRIAGHLASAATSPDSNGVYGRIYLNHNLIYEHFVPPTDYTGVDYSLPEVFNTGDILDFVIAPNGLADTATFSSVVSISLPGSGGTVTTDMMRSSAGKLPSLRRTVFRPTRQVAHVPAFLQQRSSSVDR